MPHPQTFDGSKVIAFPPLGAREQRAIRDEDTERGTILLFTGVRYERAGDGLIEAEANDFGGERRDEIWS